MHFDKTVMKVSHSQFQSKAHQSQLASKKASHTPWLLVRKVEGMSKSQLNLIMCHQKQTGCQDKNRAPDNY